MYVHSICSGKIIPKESKHWVKMPKLYVQLKKAPPYYRWKSLEAPSSPDTPSAMEIPPAPRMGVSNLKGVNTTDTPPKNSLSDKATRPISSTPQNVARPVDKQKSSSLAGGAGNAAAAVKAGTIVKLVDMSHTGLINIGNTCYMNSIIQSLSNTRELRDYLISELHMFVYCISMCVYCVCVCVCHTCTTHTHTTNIQAHTHTHTHTRVCVCMCVVCMCAYCVVRMCA